jgi:hypothetical protein
MQNTECKENQVSPLLTYAEQNGRISAEDWYKMRSTMRNSADSFNRKKSQPNDGVASVIGY